MDRSCDCCPNPAVVHETLVRNGARTEIHLCAEHALERGYILPTAAGPALIVGKLLEKASQGQPQPRAVKTCPGCAMTMQALRESGLVGCAICYRHFEEELGGVIERTQEGATAHIGRHPSHASELIDRAAARNRLVRELREAVAREEYERAAKLRDQMLALGFDGGRGPDGSDDDGGAGDDAGEGGTP
jgi:protein arginine kinase activator